MKRLFIYIAVAILVVFQSAQAQLPQAGALDTTFNFGKPHSYFTDPVNPAFGARANGPIRSMMLQPDGKILIGGHFSSYNGALRNKIARLNTDGNVDSSFNPGLGANSNVYTLAIQPDNKIIIGGLFNSYNGTPRNQIARLNPNGSLDLTFTPSNGANASVFAMALQPDGKILIAGQFTSYNGTSRNRIARLNADGSLDATFAPGTGANQSIRTIALQPDGKVLIGGDFTNFNGVARNYIARLNSNGSLDTSFTVGSGMNNAVLTIAIQTDGKIVTGGNFTSYRGTPFNRIIRMNSNGSIDTTFNPGTGLDDANRIIVIQPNGKLLIGGYFSSFNGVNCNGMARLNADGKLDTSFNIGLEGLGGANDFVIQPNGNILIGGEFNLFSGRSFNCIARVDTNGILEPSFNLSPATGANGPVLALAVQSNGKMLIGGQFTNYNDRPSSRFARLNVDGSLDTSFNSGSGPNGPVSAILLQPNGKILIGGGFTSYNGISRGSIARLNSDGSLDSTLNTVTGYLYSIVLQPDGKMLIGGNFSTVNGNPRRSIARLNTDGSLDTTFNLGTGPNSFSIIFAIALQADGKVIVGGDFTSFNGVPRRGLARLHADGRLDTSYNTTSGVIYFVTALKLQPDNKLLVGGINGFFAPSHNGINRLNTDGSLDSAFNSAVGTGMGLGPGSPVFTLALQSDGKIIIGGDFTTFNNISRNNIARLNSDGSLDMAFNPGSGANNRIDALALLPDGTLLASGTFNTYNGFHRSRISRAISSDCAIPITNTTSANNICDGSSKSLIGTVGSSWRMLSGPGHITGSTYNASGGSGIVEIYNQIGYCVSPIVTFTVLPNPVVNITQSGDTLKANSAMAAYQWLRGGLEIAGATSMSYIPTQSGFYSVKVTDTEGCIGMSDSINITITGSSVKEEWKMLSWSTYPVPFDEQLTIEAPSPFSYQVLDVRGAVRYEGRTENSEVVILTTDLASGMYLVKIVVDGQAYTRKVVRK